MNYFYLFCCTFFTLNLNAQIELPELFSTQLKQLNADIFRPLDAGYKTISITGEDYVPAQFAIYSRQEKMEIRYYARTYQELGYFADSPHVDASRIVMNTATNYGELATTVHSFAPEDRKALGADWAKLFTFKPKTGFSQTEYAQMIAIYKENVGIIYIFLLFNDAPETLDSRQVAARFF